MSQSEYETIDVPAVGEVRARVGTSTLELAGGIKYWHDKYRSARKDGFIAASFLIITAEVVLGIIYHYLRSH